MGRHLKPPRRARRHRPSSPDSGPRARRRAVEPLARAVLMAELVSVLVGFGAALLPTGRSVVVCWREPEVGGVLWAGWLLATTLSLPVVAWVITRRMTGELTPWRGWRRDVAQLATGQAGCGTLLLLVITLCAAAIGARAGAYVLLIGAAFVASVEQVGYVCTRSRDVGGAVGDLGPPGSRRP